MTFLHPQLLIEKTLFLCPSHCRRIFKATHLLALIREHQRRPKGRTTNLKQPKTVKPQSNKHTKSLPSEKLFKRNLFEFTIYTESKFINTSSGQAASLKPSKDATQKSGTEIFLY